MRMSVGVGPFRFYGGRSKKSTPMPPVFGQIVFILAAIRGLRVFTEVFLLTKGGPNGSTEVVMTLIYKLGLEQNRLGAISPQALGATAAALLLFWVTFATLRTLHHFADVPWSFGAMWASRAAASDCTTSGRSSARFRCSAGSVGRWYSSTGGFP